MLGTADDGTVAVAVAVAVAAPDMTKTTMFVCVCLRGGLLNSALKLLSERKD